MKLDKIQLGELAYIVEEALFRRWIRPRYSKHQGYRALRGLLKYYQSEVAQLKAEKEFLKQLLIYHGHLPTCPQFTGPYDLGELEPACTCGHNTLEKDYLP